VRYEEMSPAALMRAATRRRINEQYLVNANRGLGNRLDAIAKEFPHLNAATAMAMAEQGYDKDSVEVRTLARLQVDRDKDDGWWGDIKRHWSDSVEATAKATVRTSLSAAAAPYEQIQAYVRSGIEDPSQFINPASYKPGGGGHFMQSKLGRSLGGQTRIGAAAQVADEADISIPQALNNLPQMGDDRDPAALLEREQQTWLSGPNSLAEKRQVVNARNAGQINGRATTFGRAAGWVVGFDPGGAAHGIMSRVLEMSNSPFLKDEDDIERWINYAQTGFEGGVDLTAVFTLDPVGRVSAARARDISRGNAGVNFLGRGTSGRFAGPTTPIRVPFTETVDAAKFGGEAGVPITVNGLRKTMVYQNAVDWVTKTKQGDRLAKYLAAETDYNRLAHVMGRQTKPSTILRLLAIKDPAEAKVAFMDEVGNGFIERTPTLTAADMGAVGEHANKVASILSATTRRPQARWRQLAPSETFASRDDPAWAVEQYRRMLNSMRVGAAADTLTPEFISKNVEDFARGVVDDSGDWSVPYLAAMEAARTALIGNKVRQTDADRITSIWHQQVLGERNYWIDQTTRKSKHAFITVDAEDLPLPKAAAYAEMFTEGIPLIDTQAFTRAASRMRRLYDSPGWDIAVTGGDAMTAFFKFMVLPVRGPAWMIRNLAEAQARITVLGMPGIMNDPLGALAWRLGDNPRSQASKDLAGWDKLAHPQRELRAANMERYGRGQFDSKGDDFRVRMELEGNASQFAKTQEHKGGPWNDTNNMVYSDDVVPVNRDERGMRETWLDGHRFTLAKLSGSPEYRMAIDAKTPLHAKNMFWASKERKRMMQREPSLASREGSDFYIDKVYERIEEATNGNPALRDAIRQGRIDGVPLVVRNARGNLVYNEKAILALEKHADDLPEWSAAPKAAAIGNVGDAIGKFGAAIDKKVFATAFALFGSMPNNRFVNSPLFRQLHWDEAERLMPLAAPEARAAILANARKARMSKDMLARLEALNTRQVPELSEVRFSDKSLPDFEHGGYTMRLTRVEDDPGQWVMRAVNSEGEEVGTWQFVYAEEGLFGHMIHVREGLRGQGHGSALNRAAEELADRLNLPLYRTTLVNQTHAANLRGRGYVPARPITQARMPNGERIDLQENMVDDAMAEQWLVRGAAPAGGKLDVDDIRDLADAKAFDKWMDIVYNSHNKGNWTRSIRMLSPFAAAVADMYRFWGKNLAKNPLVLHRVDQGMHAARQSGFIANDDNGEERFFYPLTRALAQVATGVDRAFSGSVKGANMITSSVLPGVGPVVSWPVGLFLPDKPETDAIREIINPYGDPDASGGILEGFAPSHVQRMLATVGLASPEQQRRYQESVADAMAYLASTGRYGDSEKEQERLRNDAQAKGRTLYLLQAWAQSSLPASPRGETMYKDPTGRVWQMAHVAADYRKMMNDNPDEATANLLKKYGEAAFLAVTGGTYGSSAFVTEEAHDLARDKPHVIDRYSEVWSFFTDQDSPYSHAEMQRQLKAGERTTRSLKERQVAAQTTLAWNMYFQYKDQFGPFPTTEEENYLQTVKASIRKELPLWDESFDVSEVQTRVDQTFKAAKDPVFRDTEVSGAILAYQKARQEVIDYARSQGDIKATGTGSGFGTAKATEDGRDYLRFVAQQLIEQVPQFEVFWQRVFDAEMVDDVEGAP
jgi:GNAT superfamily N-acetyltransferase